MEIRRGEIWLANLSPTLIVDVVWVERNEIDDVNPNNWMYRNFNLPTKNAKRTKSLSRTLASFVGISLNKISLTFERREV